MNNINNEVIKKLNAYERFILKIHRKLFIKICNSIRIEIVNKML